MVAVRGADTVTGFCWKEEAELCHQTDGGCRGEQVKVRKQVDGFSVNAEDSRNLEVKLTCI